MLAQVGWQSWPAVEGGETGAARYPVLSGTEPWLGQIDRVPLGSTPLSVLVAENPRLGGRIAVKGVEQQPGALRLTLVDRDAPKEGEITLVFSEAPFDLRQWRVTDARGQSTQVTLSDKEVNRPLPASLFVFIDPVPGRRGGDR